MSEDLRPMSWRTAAACAALVVSAVAVGLLPALVGLGWAPLPAGRLLAGLGGLAVVVGGVKLLAVMWAVARLPASHTARMASASID